MLPCSLRFAYYLDCTISHLWCCLAIYQMATIRDAFSHWADNTCVRFKEVPTDQQVSTNHILITSASTGYIGYSCIV